MKQFLALTTLMLSVGCNSHHQSDCMENKLLNNLIKCDTITLRNKSLLYRQFNCDSSWLIFEYKPGQRKQLCSLEKGLLEMSDRLGYQFEIEYKNALLFQNRQVSGGGFPIDYVLIDKQNGEVSKDNGPLLYFSKDYDLGFLIYLSDSSTLTLYNVDTKKSFNFTIPENRIDNTMKQYGGMFPEHLFDEPLKKNDTIILSYKFQKQNDSAHWFVDKMIIDLKKYAR